MLALHGRVITNVLEITEANPFFVPGVHRVVTRLGSG